MDIESALRRVADRRIEEAMRQGKFDNLAGAGKPLDLEPMPAEENARLTWWALRILRQNGVVPDEVQLRKQIDEFCELLAGAGDSNQKRTLGQQINALICKLNTLGTNAIAAGIAPISAVE